MRAKDYFMGKRAAVIGIGAHGEMLSDIKFMVKSNALVSVYDLRSESRLSEHLVSLRSFGLANMVLGSVPPEDLLDMDVIILSHEYPRDSSFLSEARKAGVDIEYPETLFLKLAPPVSVIGVMGACGKATIVSMLEPMISEACEKSGQSCVAADPESGAGILASLAKLKSGDIAIMRISPRMMAEISALRWSPQVAVFANKPGGRTLKHPFEILQYQTYNNYVIGSDSVIDAVRASGYQSKAKMIRTKPQIVREEWLPKARSPHDRENAALALEAARVFKVPDEAAEESLSRWQPLRGRLEPLKKGKVAEFVNDGASESPIATAASLSIISKDKNVILIFGGCDLGEDFGLFHAAVKEHVHTVISVPGSGTMRERRALERIEGLKVISVPTLEEAVRQAADLAKKGDKVLFSPAFEACGIDASRKERIERFARVVRSL